VGLVGLFVRVLPEEIGDACQAFGLFAEDLLLEAFVAVFHALIVVFEVFDEA
jgi:hypothetical protein